MRDMFIRALEVVINVFVVIMIIGVVIGAGAVAFGGPMQPGMPGGPLMGLAVLLGGALYVIFVAGFMYLGLGIYQNTKRAAELMESKGM